MLQQVYQCARPQQSAADQGLKQQMFFSQFWQLELQVGGVSKVASSWGLSRWCADSRLLCMSSHCLSCVCVCVLISSCKDTHHIGSGPTLKTSFYLNLLFKGPISKQSHSEVLGVRASGCEFGLVGRTLGASLRRADSSARGCECTGDAGNVRDVDKWMDGCCAEKCQAEGAP